MWEGEAFSAQQLEALDRVTLCCGFFFLSAEAVVLIARFFSFETGE